MSSLQALPIEVTYLGGPTALLSIAGVRLLTDPTFDPTGRTYRSGAVTLWKLRGPARQPGEIGRLDAALVSHEQHPDNLDLAGRELLKQVPRVLTTPASAKALGGNAIGMAPWDSTVLRSPQGASLRITATPARHGPAGVERLAGEVTGFVVSALESDEDLVYVTGDTVWFEGTAEVARRFRPRVVVLHAGAARTARGPFHLTMDTNDALETAAAFPEAALLPVHHEGWAHFTQSQRDLVAAFSALGFSDRLQPVEPGASYRFEALDPQRSRAPAHRPQWPERSAFRSSVPAKSAS